MGTLRSPRFDADGNIQLNRRGLLGAFGVPIAGEIVGAGTASTLGVTVLYLGAPAIGSEVIPAAKIEYRYRAGGDFTVLEGTKRILTKETNIAMMLVFFYWWKFLHSDFTLADYN